jgi:hypothetical protein
MLYEPSIQEVRSAIESVQPDVVKYALMTTFLCCARAGEVCAYKTAHDKTAHPTGQFLTARTETYTPNLSNSSELQALMLKHLKTGTNINMAKLAKTKEKFLIFKVLTEKRNYEVLPDGSFKHVWDRECAIPTNPMYEPWSKPLISYLQTRKGKPYFPLNRHDMWQACKTAFKNYGYLIQPYARAIIINGQYQYVANNKGEKKLAKTQVEEKLKSAGVHALRHWRTTDLKRKNFTTEEINAYGGWTTQGSQSRYDKIPWQQTAPKLLVPNQQQE